MAAEPFYTAKEAAELSSVAESTIRKYIRNGRLRAVKHGKTRQISATALCETFPDESIIPREKPHTVPHAVAHTAHLERAKSAELERDLLRQENERLQRRLDDTSNSIRALGQQNDRLLTELTESRLRSDAIIQGLSQQLDRAQLALEDMSKRRTVWQKVKAVFAVESMG